MTASWKRLWTKFSAQWGGALDWADFACCRFGLLPPADWDQLAQKKTVRLYAGKLSRRLPQYQTHIGLTPLFPSTRNIRHDVCVKTALPDNSVDTYQSEDVFEHVSYASLTVIFNEIYRILKPGGLFRLSLPDYRSDLYLNRSQRDSQGSILFDPGGGGSFVDGEVINGGHLWFPIHESVQALFTHSPFKDVRYLHYTDQAGEPVMEDIDYSLGYIQRTPDHDDRVKEPRRPLSIVVDARK